MTTRVIRRYNICKLKLPKCICVAVIMCDICMRGMCDIYIYLRKASCNSWKAWLYRVELIHRNFIQAKGCEWKLQRLGSAVRIIKKKKTHIHSEAIYSQSDHTVSVCFIPFVLNLPVIRNVTSYPISLLLAV